jgi:hypothetical protein
VDAGGAAAGSTLDLGASFTSVPGGTANWSFTGGTNYNDQASSVAVEIGKANAVCTINGYSGTYDASAHAATGSCTGVDAGGAAAGSSLDLGASFTNVPGGTANWSFAGGTNYNDQASSVAIEIGKADAVCSVTGYSVTYDAASHTATGSCTGVGGEDDVLAGLDLSGTTHTNAGTYGADPWTFTDVTGNYSNTSGTVADAIAKADATVTVSGYTGVYNGNPHSATATIAGVTADPTAAGSSFNPGASFTNVPGGTAYWTFNGGTNYNDQSGNAAIVLTKASSSTTTVGDGPFVYDGTTHAGGTGTVTGAGGLNTSATSVTYTGDRVNAGTYYVTAHYAGDGNHYPSDGLPVAIVINKASSATTTVGAGPFTYDGTTHAGGSGTVTGAGGLSTTATSLTYTGDQVNAGTYYVTAHYAGDANHDPSDGAPVAIVINKATPGVSVTGGSFFFTGSPQGGSGFAYGIGGVADVLTPPVTLSYAGTGSTTYGPSATAPSGVGTYQVTANFAGNGNYTAKSNSASLTIGSWTLKGFYQPVDMGGVYNTAKNGSTVPLKFEVFSGTTELTDVAAVKTMASAEFACNTTVPEDALEELVATGGTVLRYDSTGGQFIYNWKTPAKPNKCFKVVLTTQDGSKVEALFKLK